MEKAINIIETFLTDQNNQFAIFLTQREMAVLNLRKQGKTLQEIGNSLKLTRERVRQIEETALRRQAKKKELAEGIFNAIRQYFFTEEEVEKAFSLWYITLDNPNFIEEKINFQDFIKTLWEQKNKKETNT